MTALAGLAGRATSLRLPKIDARLVVGLLLVALSVIGGLRLAATSDRDGAGLRRRSRPSRPTTS